MATAEEELLVLREKNNELVQKVQHWKMLAAQRENEKLELMKELNDMRLKLARLRSSGNMQTSKLESALQSASEKALAYLVKASGEITRSIDSARTYIRERKETEALSPRWSSIGGTPKVEKIHRVPPMVYGGQSIQPVVSLSRNDVLYQMNTSNPRPAEPNANRNVTQRALPMHMLQDAYIPLTRIDAEIPNYMDTEEPDNSADSADELGLENSGERSDLEESQRMSDDDYNSSRRLDAVAEDPEPEEEVGTPQSNSRTENPLEGPSWLLDAPRSSRQRAPPKIAGCLEPDSTTEVEEISTTPVAAGRSDDPPESVPRVAGRLTQEFSPTVRRRKRTSSPSPPLATPRRDHFSPRPHHRRNSNNERILKVMVAKMRLESLSPGGPPSPLSPAAKRRASDLDLDLDRELLDAPSPNGATVPGVIVSETIQDPGGSGEPVQMSRRTRRPSHDLWRPTEHRRPTDHRRPTHDPRPSRERRSDRSSQERDTRMDESEEEETRVKQERESRDSRNQRQDMSSRVGSSESRDSDSGSEAGGGAGGAAGGGGLTRTRRARNKVLSYQERPLNRKLRR